jgi:hypothetical protein
MPRSHKILLRPLRLLFLALVLLSSASSLKAEISINWNKLLMKEREESIIRVYSLKQENTLVVEALDGSVSIRPSLKNSFKLMATKRGTDDQLPTTTIESTLKDDTVTVKTNVQENQTPLIVDYTLLVPRNITKIYITAHNSTVKIDEVDSALSVIVHTGNIEIVGATKSVYAKTDKGEIYLDQKTFPEDASLFLESLQGPIQLMLSKRAQGCLQARTHKGTITCDIPVTLDPITTVLTRDAWKRMQKTINGTFGTGKAPITLEAGKGSITIKGK